MRKRPACGALRPGWRAVAADGGKRVKTTVLLG